MPEQRESPLTAATVAGDVSNGGQPSDPHYTSSLAGVQVFEATLAAMQVQPNGTAPPAEPIDRVTLRFSI